MSGRIEVDMSLNASGVARGAKDAEKALQGLEDAVQEAGGSGAKDINKLEEELRDVQRESRDTGRVVGSSLDDGFDRAGKGAEDFKQEANSTAREAAASFDGSAESIGDAFQEVAANAFSGFGPAGAVAGLAAAAGIGIAIEAIGAAGEEQEKVNERVAEWADAYVEAGERVLSAGVLASRFQAIITDPEKFKTAEENARNWGVTVETAIAAMSGDATALGAVQTSVDAIGDALKDTTGAEAAIDAYGNVNTKLYEQDTAYKTAVDSLTKLTGEMSAGADRAALLSSYYEGVVNSASGATKEVDALGNELYELPDGTKIVVDAETGIASQNVDKFKGDVDGIKENVTTTVKFNVDDSAVRNYRAPVLHIPGRLVLKGQTELF